VQLRIAQHEIGAGLADLGAVGEQADVMRLRKPATLIKTVSQRLQTDAVTATALFYALLHAAIAMLHRVSLTNEIRDASMTAEFAS
jgi:hypothetical protein